MDQNSAWFSISGRGVKAIREDCPTDKEEWKNVLSFILISFLRRWNYSHYLTLHSANKEDSLISEKGPHRDHIELLSSEMVEVSKRLQDNFKKIKIAKHRKWKNTDRRWIKTKADFTLNDDKKKDEIIELEWPITSSMKLVLFYCDWFDTSKNGMKVDIDFGIIEVRKRRRYSKFDPFNFPLTTTQVYCASHPENKGDKAD
uniref:DUF4216 domain-containing protein n=1 Tax=Solanum lycopersicum TaxID=4081 RepID=A0A3Q7I2H8_SOLLC